jgi:hypothetical protein
VLSITEAAIATGKSRRTIARLLDAGRLDGAERDDAGTWRIPAEALIAAGLTLYAPAPPDAPSTTPPPIASERQVDALRAELADWRRRAEVAEAIAAERAAALDDVRTALAMANRMLAPGPPTEGPPGPAPEIGNSVLPISPPTLADTSLTRRLLNRYRRNRP